jgi:ABC-type uncharacterized transport system ATPase subunit
MYGDVVETGNGDGKSGKVALRIHREQVTEVMTRLLADLTVADFSMEDPPLESVIDQVYREGIA